MTDAQAGYDQAVQSQIAQYADVGEMHDLPEAMHHVNQRSFEPALERVFGTHDLVAIYATHLSGAAARTGLHDVVSIGSGTGDLEIEIADHARRADLRPFRIICLELSPILVARTRESARAAGLQDLIVPREADLNRGLPLEQRVAAFFASHSLHHLIELELIFDQVTALMHPEGAFVVSDMIGRNGHMRWPETLAVVRPIWAQLPDRLKWDHLLGRLDRWYENWDCSNEGFEGVRAQDILPLLLARFRFETFVATHGLTDAFAERRFGANFDVERPEDRAFLDKICELEERLLRHGTVTPTQMLAVLRNARGPQHATRCFDGLTPQKACRWPHAPVAVAVTEAAGFVSPYPPQPPAPLEVLPVGGRIAFTQEGRARSLARWGWDEPGADFTWSIGADAAIEFTVASPCAVLRLHFVPYRPPGGERNRLTVLVNGRKELELDVTDRSSCDIALREPLAGSERVLLELVISRPRKPDIDDGGDKRPTGIALLAFELARDMRELARADFISRHPAAASAPLAVLPLGEWISFSATGRAPSLARWGWDEPGADFTWSIGADAAIEFTVASPCAVLRLHFVPYRPPGGERSRLTVLVNGRKELELDVTDRSSCDIALREPLAGSERVLLELVISRPRNPEIDGGADKRPTGIALLAFELARDMRELARADFISRHPAAASAPLAVLPLGEWISFSATGRAPSLARWGWDEPGSDFTWSIGADAAIEFTVASPCAALRLHFVPYRPPGGERNRLTVLVNGRKELELDVTDRSSCDIALREPLAGSERVLLELVISRPRNPEIDGGADKRPIGIALLAFELARNARRLP